MAQKKEKDGQLTVLNTPKNLVLRLRILRGVEGIWRNIHMLQYGAYNIPEYWCRDASAEVVACGGVVNHNH